MMQMTRYVEVQPMPPEEPRLQSAEIWHRDHQHAFRADHGPQSSGVARGIRHMLQNVPQRDALIWSAIGRFFDRSQHRLLRPGGSSVPFNARGLPTGGAHGVEEPAVAAPE